MPTVDPHWDKVKLLIQSSGPLNSTAFVDRKRHVITAGGNVKQQYSPSGFVSVFSPYFDGNADYLSVAGSTDFYCPGDFTVDMFLRTIGAQPLLFSLGNPASSNVCFYCYIYGSNLEFWYSTNGVAVTPIYMTNSIGASACYLSVQKDGSVLKVYKDAVLMGSGPISPSLYQSSGNFIVGGVHATGTLTGNIDQFRYTVGVARGIEAIPTEPFYHISNRFAGTIRDADGSLCARTVRTYDRATGVLTGSTISNASTGLFEIYSDSANIQTLMVLDDDSGSEFDPVVYDRVIPETL